MDLQTIQQQLEIGMEWFNENYEELANLESTYKQKDDFKKTQLAICEEEVVLAHLEEHGIKLTQSEINRKALASEKYQEFLEELAEARASYLRKKAEYQAKEAKYIGLQSLNKHMQ